MKFPKTIRFDNSDLNIFEIPSEEGEWAISGAFEFSNDTKENLKGKRKQSFRANRAKKYVHKSSHINFILQYDGIKLHDHNVNTK